jgi:hypothetical protein
MGSDPTNQHFSRKYGSITRDRFLLDVTNKSSLDLCQYFYIKQGKQLYLDNQNDFKASRLILLARTKTIPLQKYNSKKSDFFFPPPKSEYFFQQHWESEYFF